MLKGVCRRVRTIPNKTEIYPAHESSGKTPPVKDKTWFSLETDPPVFRIHMRKVLFLPHSGIQFNLMRICCSSRNIPTFIVFMYKYINTKDTHTCAEIGQSEFNHNRKMRHSLHDFEGGKKGVGGKIVIFLATCGNWTVKIKNFVPCGKDHHSMGSVYNSVDHRELVYDLLENPVSICIWKELYLAVRS